MPKRRVRWLGLVSVLSAWLLSGCITTLAPVQFVPREALASVNEVALAVGADGVKHYAWTECFGENATYTCVLVYARVVMGAVVYSHGFVQSIGDFARYPDVAVSSTGDAYVVYSECTDFSNCIDNWSMFPAVDPQNTKIGDNWLHTALPSEAAPQVVARGADVYAAYFVDIGGVTRLRYRQLAGGSRSGRIDTLDQFPSNVSLGIDSAGDLHAVWVRNPAADTFIAYSNNTGGVNNFNAASTFDGGFDYSFSRPDLALDDDDRVYLTYVIYNGSGDTIKVRCLDVAPDCYRNTTLLIVPEVDGGWNVYRNANLEMIGDQPNVVFAALHDSLDHNDIWWYAPPSLPDGNTPPDQVTNTSTESEGEPLIVEENSTFGDVPVVGWRKYVSLLLGTQAPAGNAGYCAGDVFVTYGGASNVRQVFEDRGTCDNSGLDLAANGQWVAGVWVDEESNLIAAHAAWTAFNARISYVPLAGK